MTSAIYQKMDTSVGLSTIASLSLGLSMSMTGSGRAVICRNLAAALPTSPHCSSDAKRLASEFRFPCLPQLPPNSAAVVGGALQAALAGPQRRTSFIGILHEMSEQNRRLSGTDSQQEAIAERRSSGSDAQREPCAEPERSSTSTKSDVTGATQRPTSDGAQCFNAAAPTFQPDDHTDVIASRDQCEYTTVHRFRPLRACTQMTCIRFHRLSVQIVIKRTDSRVVGRYQNCDGGLRYLLSVSRGL